MPNRLTGLNVSVFNLSGDYLHDMENCTLSTEVHATEAKGLADEYDYPWATGRAVTLEADVFVSTSAALLTLAATGTAQVSISYNSGGNTYSGQGLITSVNHSNTRDGLQTQKVTIKFQGAPTIV